MKMKYFALNAFAALSILTACSDDPRNLTPGVQSHDSRTQVLGTGQGNGFVAHRAKSGFSFRYRKELTLVDHGASVSVSNNDLVKNDAPVSSITFQVVDPLIEFGVAVSTVEELKTQTAEAQPETSWTDVVFPGAAGVFTEMLSESRIVSRYYVLTNNIEIVKIDIDAYVYGNGLAWVAPIIKTFTYDITAPKILEFRTSKKTWLVGTTESFEFKAVDDLSGISNFISGCAVLEHEDRGHYPSADITICGQVKSLGDDWYAVEVEVGEYLPSGRYILQNFSIEDQAANYGSASEEVVKSFEIHVENSGPEDVTPPKILQFRSSRDIWGSGSTENFEFKAIDDLSGIGEFMGGCASLRHENRELYPSARVTICGSVRSLGDDWYAVRVKVGEYLPGGRYVLENFSIEDKARNHASATPAQMQSFDVEIQAGKNVDVTPPNILELRTAKKIWRAGTNEDFEFRAIDDVSGINDFMGGCATLHHEDRNKYPSAMITICGGVRTLGHDWYAIKVEIGEHLPGGRYIFRHFHISLSDRAENYASATEDQMRAFEVFVVR